MFPEPTGDPKSSARIQRPGLALDYTLGDGPVTGAFRQAGVFSGDKFFISGGNVYREEDLLGTIALDDWSSFAALKTADGEQLAIVQGGELKVYDGTTLTTVALPDDQPCGAVKQLGGRFYYSVSGSDRVYFSDLSDATTIGGLNFFTAESLPDALTTIATLGDQMVFLGTNSIEFWSQTGDQDAPLIRASGATYDKGCIAPNTIQPIDNRLFWLGSDLKVYTLGPQRVSSHSIEALLEECASPEDCVAFTVTAQGHDFYVLDIPDKGTFAYHIEQGNPEFAWSEWTSNGSPFRGQNSINVDGVTYIGDKTSGRVFHFDCASYTDDGEVIERVVSALVPAGDWPQLELIVSTGTGPVSGTEMFVDMRYSKNMRTFTDWRSKSLGTFGEYDKRVRWNALGWSKNPRLVEFRTVSDAQVHYVRAE